MTLCSVEVLSGSTPVHEEATNAVDDGVSDGMKPEKGKVEARIAVEPKDAAAIETRAVVKEMARQCTVCAVAGCKCWRWNDKMAACQYKCFCGNSFRKPRRWSNVSSSSGGSEEKAAGTEENDSIEAFPTRQLLSEIVDKVVNAGAMAEEKAAVSKNKRGKKKAQRKLEEAEKFEKEARGEEIVPLIVTEQPQEAEKAAKEVRRKELATCIAVERDKPKKVAEAEKFATEAARKHNDSLLELEQARKVAAQVVKIRAEQIQVTGGPMAAEVFLWETALKYNIVF
eukprot:TRINITY_DN51623_c0_g1_i1.p1 TRINITY_DN51623_c0_g1~~TRINITY_DN51623_c0_g1_i1.p1  ORF type:complete len:284 (-),score=82.09 TRINITY_DN51623_c0_g1_i1:43-894(-)